MNLLGSSVKDMRLGGNSKTGNKIYKKYWYSYKHNHMLGSWKKEFRKNMKPIKMKNELIHHYILDSHIGDIEWQNIWTRSICLFIREKNCLGKYPKFKKSVEIRPLILLPSQEN